MICMKMPVKRLTDYTRCFNIRYNNKIKKKKNLDTSPYHSQYDIILVILSFESTFYACFHFENSEEFNVIII